MPKWELKGDYFESCNCDVACPCVFLSDPTTGECTVVLAYHVNTGFHGKTKLDNLNVAAAFHSPGNMTKGNWKGAVYIDDRASDAQREALSNIFSGKEGGSTAGFGKLVSKMVGVKKAKIDFSMDGKKRSVRIPKVLEMDTEGQAGADGGDILITNHNFDAEGFPAIVGRSKRLSYHDHGWSWELSDKNAFYSAFKYAG